MAELEGELGPDQSIDRVGVALDDTCGRTVGFDAEAFAERCCDWGVDLRGFEGARLELDGLEVSGGEASGEIVVHGQRYPGCTRLPDVPGAAAMSIDCPGSYAEARVESTELGRFRVGLGP